MKDNNNNDNYNIKSALLMSFARTMQQTRKLKEQCEHEQEADEGSNGGQKLRPLRNTASTKPKCF